MDTSYEKICPGCGKPEAISAKFCAACGHQYRTVFHDSGPSDAVALSAPSSVFADSRTPPVALIAVTAFLVILCFLVIVFASRPAATLPPPAPQTIAAATAGASAAELANQIHFGQNPDAVRAIAGEPTKITRSMAGAQTTEDWYYVRGGRTVQVHFNGNQVVDSLNTF